MADISDPLLPFQYKIVDDNSVEEGANNSQDKVVISTILNESYKWSNVKNTSSRKKMKF
ncbi:4268_t:CDS:2 [Funneliformis mosseae]|uniref:4268_t:CDS:1 n=1 Tax=Funneliformis mosseae TaxID=27381 RepID=A0A9N8V5Y1_FUNMO|nr:4268_t:CDS:2 [Funneliformis mosseae]